MPDARIQTGQVQFDIDARENEVLGRGPRLKPLAPDEFSPEARELSDTVRALFGVKDLSGIPDMFATMFKHPGVYRSQMQFGLELNMHGSLPARERELAILRAAWLARSPFEWGEHVEVAKKCGLASEEIDRIRLGSDAKGWSEQDQAILLGVEELVGDYLISDATWERLGRFWDDKKLIEFPGLVGAYVLTAMIYNTLGFALLEGNIGFRQR